MNIDDGCVDNCVRRIVVIVFPQMELNINDIAYTYIVLKSKVMIPCDPVRSPKLSLAVDLQKVPLS